MQGIIFLAFLAFPSVLFESKSKSKSNKGVNKKNIFWRGSMFSLKGKGKKSAKLSFPSFIRNSLKGPRTNSYTRKGFLSLSGNVQRLVINIKGKGSTISPCNYFFLQVLQRF